MGIRRAGIVIGGADHPGFGAVLIGPPIATLVVDQTSWALATYVMFRLALRACRAPVRRVVTRLAVLAVPLTVLRFREPP